MGLYGPTRWIAFKRDRTAFFAFLGTVAAVLGGAQPADDARCEWCRYRGRQTA